MTGRTDSDAQQEELGTVPQRRRRWRLGLLLLLNFRRAVAFAGGWRRFLLTVGGLWRSHGYRAVAGWAVGAVSHGQHANAKRYGAWLRRRSARPAPAGRMLAVMSTEGVPVDQLQTYLALAHEKKPSSCTLVVVTNAAGATTLGDSGARREHAAKLVVVPALSVDAVIAVARARCGTADFIALVAPGCVLAEAPCPETSDAVLYYGDEDRINAHGARSQPYFKPAFSPDLLFAQDYLSASLILPRSLAAALPTEPCGDYHSLALHLAQAAQRVAHLDAFVAHRFYSPPKPVAPPAALASTLRIRYGNGAAVLTTGNGWRCTFGNADAKVAVVIPTRDRVDLLQRCVAGVFASNRGDFEVLVLDNGSTEPATLAWLTEAQRRWPKLRVLDAPGEFNWSGLNNHGMAATDADVFVFLNNDTEPACEDWLAELADVALRRDVGMVGALLLYDTGTIQHAGVVVGYGRCADHVYRQTRPDEQDHMFVSPLMPRNVAAVTGACMAVARRTIDAIGPFDEAYRVSGSDVEICIRAMNAGYLNVYLPSVRLLHHEMQTRGRRDPPGDVTRLMAFLAENCPQDPYYNRNLSLQSLYPSYPL